MNTYFKSTVCAGFLTLAILPVTSSATPSELKMFGAAAPFTIDRLPVGRLKNKLNSLPGPAKDKAMKWLHSFSFPADDVAFLDVDSKGGVFYQDTVLPDEITQTELESNPELEGISPTAAFNLHSRPGATNVVYLDFTGHYLTATAWNNNADGTTTDYQALPFDKDGDNSTFSDLERADIAEIWHRVAEDFSSFDIDVTTEEPASFGANTGRILITSNHDASNNPMPHYTSGGVAYVNVWGVSYYEHYQPALVYYDNLASAPYYIAEASSHELGHNLGLSHDGTIAHDGIAAQGYYTGHGLGFVSWAPVMGVGYYKNVTQWSRGEYLYANNTQDDLAIIDSKLQYRADDHADSIAYATALLIDGNGHLASSNPEFDALNYRPDNKGVIETNTDVDVFFFETGAGAVELTINPAWDAFTRTSKRGANLDIQATIFDSSGQEVISNPIDETNATISVLLNKGLYYLEIAGSENIDSPYTNYGSLGQYYISGSVVTINNDTTPPDSTPAINSITAIDRNSIGMTATTVTDDSGFVEYQFICVSGASVCTASGWQSSVEYVATGLETNTQYSYQVRARDGSGNETDLSAQAFETTLANSVPVSANDSEYTNENTPVTIDVLNNDSDADGDTLLITGMSVPVNGATVTNGTTITYTPNADYIGIDSFSYTIEDGVGGISTSQVTVEVVSVNNPPVANSDTAEVLIGGAVTIDALINDSDPEGSVLSIISVTNGNKGTTSYNPVDNTISYQAGNRRGGDSFTYTIEDDGGLTATGTINISIVRRLSDSGDTTTTTNTKKCNPKKGC